MPLGNERRNRIKASPEEARKRLEIIQRERERVKKEILEKQKNKRLEVKDFLARRKKNLEAVKTEKVPLPPRTREIKYADLSNFISKKKSNRVFIIGGGESIKNIDLSLLINEDTITVNRSLFSVPDATFFLSMDNTFYGKITQEERNSLINFKGEKIFIANFASGVLEDKNGIIRDTKNRTDYELSFYNSIIKAPLKENRFGESLEEFNAGNNSGFGAIQLAIIMGYEEIYLIGLDFISINSTHFHGGYGERVIPFNEKLRKYQESMIPTIQEYNERRNKKSKIISCSPYSGLNDYMEYKDFKELDFKKKEMKTLDDLMVVGYYTVGTPYEKEAQKTIRSCVSLGLKYDIQGIPSLGNWQANTRYKAKFMLEMLEKHKGKRLLYVDCDAIIKMRPSLFENYSCDIAVRYQDFRWRKNECLSGTIYMENNERTKKLCEIWRDRNISEGEQASSFEQWNLGSAIQEMIKIGGLNFRNLPPEYTFIFDTMKQIYPNLKPVIEHFQASRQFKTKL